MVLELGRRRKRRGEEEERITGKEKGNDKRKNNDRASSIDTAQPNPAQLQGQMKKKAEATRLRNTELGRGWTGLVRPSHDRKLSCWNVGDTGGKAARKRR